MNLYALAADALVFLHLIYLAFTVGGEAAVLVGAAAGWRWVRNRLFRLLHLAAVLFVAFEALLGMWCPLTLWEYRLRRLAGQGGEEDISFVGRLIRDILFWEFPSRFFLFLYLGFGLLVLGSFLLIPPVKRPSEQLEGP